MPEQYQLPGIVHGLRWIADGDYSDHRLAARGALTELGNVVHYLVGDPVERTFDDFVALGRALRDNGRFPVVRPSLHVAGLRLLQWHAAPHALVSDAIVPFRPHRGVVLIVEEPHDRVGSLAVRLRAPRRGLIVLLAVEQRKTDAADGSRGRRDRRGRGGDEHVGLQRRR